MNVKTVQINWHNRDPILAVDFDPIYKERFATAGADHTVRIWRVFCNKEKGNGRPHIEFLSNLSRHAAAVNALRFSPNGACLATAGDDGCIMLWHPPVVSYGSSDNALDGSDCNQNERRSFTTGGNLSAQDEEYNKELWNLNKALRGSPADLYDLAWSPDSTLLLSASIDNTARIWQVSTGKCLKVLTVHNHFVQGVAWDPLNKYLATISSDRTLQTYEIVKVQAGNVQLQQLPTVSRMLYSVVETSSLKDCDEGVRSAGGAPSQPKYYRMFHDETLKSFFRRMSFSPDGNLLAVPAGVHRQSPAALEARSNTVYIFTRGSLGKMPVAHLPGHSTPAIAIRFCPIAYQLRADFDGEPLFKLPYRYVFAVATQDAVTIYDTQQLNPIALIKDLHYGMLTDVAWSHDGRYLILVSTDGYCSIACFQNAELGTPYGSTPQQSGAATKVTSKGSIGSMLQFSPAAEPVSKPQVF